VKQLLGILALAALAGCDAAAAEQSKAVGACRAAIASHLVDAPSPRFEEIRVSNRGGELGWFVSVQVTALDGSGARRRDRVRCQLDRSLQVVDLTH
jgi:hypothetical protein